MGTFRPRDIESNDPAELRRQLNDIQKALFQDLQRLEQRTSVSAVQTGATYSAKFGETVRLSPASTGLRLILPPATLAQANARVMAVVEGEAGALSVEAVDTTVNGEETLTYDPGIGTIEFTLTPEGWFALSLSMHYVDGTIALDKLEDIVGPAVLGILTGTGPPEELAPTAGRQALMSDAAGTAIAWRAIVLADFPAQAAKSVLANATNASAVPAALAGSAAFQHLRVNSANNALEWATLSGYASTSVIYASNTFEVAAFTGDVTKAQNSNVTAIGAGVIVDADVNGSAAIDPAKLGALTGDVTKASGSAVTAIGSGVIVDADVNASAAIATSKLADGSDFARLATSNTFAASIAINQMLVLAGVLNTTIAATTNNLAIGSVSIVRLTLTGAQTLTGMVPTLDNQIVLIINADSGDDLTIAHNSGSSSAGNQFLCPGGVNFVLQERGFGLAIWDVLSDFWHLGSR
jgi:hypothetical protein